MQDGTGQICAIIIAYNAEKYLSDAIESVLCQTHPIDEILVVDDGSIDATSAVAKHFCSSGVKCIRQPNQGPAQARNTGIGATKAEFIALLDGDDIWLPDKTEMQMKILQERPELLMVSGGKIWWEEEKNIKTIFDYSKRLHVSVKNEIYFSNIVGNPSMTMIRRKAFDIAGLFNSNLRYGDDWEMWMRIVESGEVDFLPYPLIVYRWHVNNLSHKDLRKCQKAYMNIALHAIHKNLPKWRLPAAYLRICSDFFLRPHLRYWKERLKASVVQSSVS